MFGNMTEADYIDTRQVGDAQVTIMSEGTLTWTPHFPVPVEVARAAMPDAGPDGALTLGLNVCLIRLGDALVLIDPGCDTPDSEWQVHFAARNAPVVRTTGLLAGLASLGVSPEQVTHVAITHNHGDHIAGLVIERQGQPAPRFANARHVIGRADWEGYSQRPDPDSEVVRCLGPVERTGLLELVDAELEIAPGVSVIHAPGESPGHCIVRVVSDGAAFFYLGDLFHHACEVECLYWVSHGDAAQATASRERLLREIVATDGLAVTSHERFPGWWRVTYDGSGYQIVPG